MIGIRPLAITLGAAAALGGCTSIPRDPPPEVPDGNPVAGAEAIQDNGCGSCHVIPGIEEANGHVGPPLTDFGKRGFIAGQLKNSGDNLILWIRDPQTVEPGTDMPDLGISEDEATDIAAYLFTLD